ncbi:hypothetical protein [Rummeliibacillus sp. POC4]|uniref:hypothetical protein n=1 Tax=Rummeliibacillus sp. POC4 TaxID=2305899 RepID=UPI000E6695B5|nr:hypothetical protein [Rummeliibacillus sp. POC4]RIJ63921.1 hypothetical protein D1606_12755 [Rummeliibacillus sp. POC4]
MTLKVNPIKGILKPNEYCAELEDAEQYSRYRLNIFFLFLISVFTYIISGAFGIGTQSISSELSSIGNHAFEARKQLFLIGRLLQGVLVPCVLIFGSALYYFAFINGSFRKLVIVQLNVFSIFLIEKIIQLPLFLLLNVDATSDIFSLGIIAQYISNNELLIHFLGELTLFRVAMLAYSYYSLSRLVESRKKVVIAATILFLLYWIFASFMSYIKIGFFF